MRQYIVYAFFILKLTYNSFTVKYTPLVYSSMSFPKYTQSVTKIKRQSPQPSDFLLSPFGQTLFSPLAPDNHRSQHIYF